MTHGPEELVLLARQIVGYIVGEKEPCRARKGHESPGVLVSRRSWENHALMCFPGILFFHPEGKVLYSVSF